MKSSLPLVAFLSVATAAAIESQQKTRAASFVSFEQWIEDIIANPKGDHLAPEEAVAAHEVIMNGTDTDLEARALEKRVVCYGSEQPLAEVIHAAACVNRLASIGGRDCTVKGMSMQLFHRSLDAKIWGTVRATDHVPATDSCQNVAITGGRIMDACTSGGAVRGFDLVNNGKFGVGLTGID